MNYISKSNNSMLMVVVVVNSRGTGGLRAERGV